MLNLNINSLDGICSYKEQVMVYGWKFCKYSEVINLLTTHPDTPCKTVFSHRLGNRNFEDKTCEGRVIEKIAFADSAHKRTHIARKCKAAIVNLVIENYKRLKDKLPLIPLIFCYDIDGKKREVKPSFIAARDLSTVGIKMITASELRRCYKLCKEFEGGPLVSISEVAKKTIKFVKLHLNNRKEYEFKELAPVWEDPCWKPSWDSRMQTKSHPPKKEGWRLDLELKVREQSCKRLLEDALLPMPKKAKTEKNLTERKSKN